MMLLADGLYVSGGVILLIVLVILIVWLMRR